VDVLDVDLNVVIEVDLHLLTVVVIQLGIVPPLYVLNVAAAAADDATS